MNLLIVRGPFVQQADGYSRTSILLSNRLKFIALTLVSRLTFLRYLHTIKFASLKVYSLTVFIILQSYAMITTTVSNFRTTSCLEETLYSLAGYWSFFIIAFQFLILLQFLCVIVCLVCFMLMDLLPVFLLFPFSFSFLFSFPSPTKTVSYYIAKLVLNSGSSCCCYNGISRCVPPRYLA